MCLNFLPPGALYVVALRCIEDGLFTARQELHHARQAQFLRRSTLSYINNHTNFSILEMYYYQVLEHFREALALKFSKTYTKPVFSLDSTTHNPVLFTISLGAIPVA